MRAFQASAATILLVAALGGVAHGQQSTPSPLGSPTGIAIARASGMVGMPVVDALGYELGRVDDLVIAADWTVDQIVLEVRGRFAAGPRRVAVPLAAFQVTESALILPRGDRDELAHLPTFERASLPQPINARGPLIESAGQQVAAAAPSLDNASRRDGWFHRQVTHVRTALDEVAAVVAIDIREVTHVVVSGWQWLSVKTQSGWETVTAWVDDSGQDVDAFVSELTREIGATMKGSYRASTVGL